MRGKPLADRIRSVVAEEVRAIGHIGLVTVLVGDDPASDIYIRLKHKAAEEAGFDTTDLRLPASTPEHALLAKLKELNDSDDVDAILVQLPLPDHLDGVVGARLPNPYGLRTLSSATGPMTADATRWLQCARPVPKVPGSLRSAMWWVPHWQGRRTVFCTPMPARKSGLLLPKPTPRN